MKVKTTPSKASNAGKLLTNTIVEIAPPIEASPVVGIPDADVVPAVPRSPPGTPPAAAHQSIAPVGTTAPSGVDEEITFVAANVVVVRASGRWVGVRGGDVNGEGGRWRRDGG